MRTHTLLVSLLSPDTCRHLAAPFPHAHPCFNPCPPHPPSHEATPVLVFTTLRKRSRAGREGGRQAGPGCGMATCWLRPRQGCRSKHGGGRQRQPTEARTHMSSSASEPAVPMRTNSAKLSLGTMSSRQYMRPAAPTSMPCTAPGRNTTTSPAETAGGGRAGDGARVGRRRRRAGGGASGHPKPTPPTRVVQCASCGRARRRPAPTWEALAAAEAGALARQDEEELVGVWVHVRRGAVVLLKHLCGRREQGRMDGNHQQCVQARGANRAGGNRQRECRTQCGKTPASLLPRSLPRFQR